MLILIRFSLALVVPVVVASAVAATARADDASAAVEELKEGYALKQADQCRDAIAHFARSFQLDAKPKALLNRADCEARLGNLVAAQADAAQGRQLAGQAGDGELSSVADEQLRAIETRLPRLAIALAPDTPKDSAVSIDGEPVDHAQLDVAEGVNPGAHTILVTAPGYMQRRFDVTLREGASERIEVRPGGRLGPADTPTPLHERSTGDATSDVWARRAPAVIALGVGTAGLVIGVATGLAGASKHTALEQECSGNACPSTAQGDINAFHTLRTISTVGYIVGFAGLAGGAALWFTVPRSRPSHGAARLWMGPTSAGVGGSF